MKYKNGDIYDGNWNDGKKHGIGKFSINGKILYHGEWIYDKKHGNGFIYDNKPTYDGVWINHGNTFVNKDILLKIFEFL
jgi:hypothetical protein